MKQIVDKRKDIAFYLKMLPLVAIHPQAYDKSKSIVCEESNEKSVVLLEDAYAKKNLLPPACDTKAVDDTLSLTSKLGINSTPTIVFGDGRIANGAMDEASLIKLIDKK